MEVGTAVVLMEATSLPALGSLMARQICFLPESGDEMMMMVVRGAWCVAEVLLTIAQVERSSCR